MANPQLENGYTRIANEIIEGLYQSDFTGQEIRCLLFIIRKTYGYHKKNDKISLSQFSEELGIGRSNVCRTLRGLKKKGVVVRDTGGVIGDTCLNKAKLVSCMTPILVSSRTHTKERKKTKDNTPIGDKQKNMYQEPTIQVDGDGEEIEVPVTPKTFGRYPSMIANHYCKLMGKTSAGRQLPAGKELMQLAQKEYPGKELAILYSEIFDRIAVAKKYYDKKGMKDWNLSKVAENWNKILTEWSKEVE